MNLLGIGLSTWLAYKFLVEQNDPGVFFVILIIVGPMVFSDIECVRKKLLSRFFLDLVVDRYGVHVYRRKKLRYAIAWEDVKVYGVTGYSMPTIGMAVPSILVYFTTREDKQRIKPGALNRHQVLFEFRADAWETIVAEIPKDIRKNLIVLLREHRDRMVLRGEIVEPEV